jgi:hypothetical protein
MRKTTLGTLIPAILAVFLAAPSPSAAPNKRPSAEDAVKIEIKVAPATVAAGTEAEVTVKLSVNPGFKLNKYPKIKLAIPTVEGLLAGGDTTLGTDAPPPPEQLDTNYFKSIDPLKVKITVEKGAQPGRHDIVAKLSYFYCVAASGFCAPGKIPLEIRLDVR